MSYIRLPALEIKQGPNRTLYSFAVDGKLLSSIATVSRLRRPEGEPIQGYQRPEVLSHIAEIRNYLESSDPLLPNALVVAFDQRVSFVPLEEQPNMTPFSRAGYLVIPMDESVHDEQKPGWIVDGQQRLAAIREARVTSFPVCVTAFIAAHEEEQREQFILVNSTKPLPKGLIYELLPGTKTHLPTLFARRRLPSQLLERLNRDPDSPLLSKISTVTNPRGIIKDNSMLKMLESSLSEGALYRFRDPITGEGDLNAMLKLLFNFWNAVKEVYSPLWGKKPKESRLLHGAGIISLGLLMDAMSDRYREKITPTKEDFAEDLRKLTTICRWNFGHWEFGGDVRRKWNEIQNTPKDIQLLSNYLLREYMNRVWNRRSSVAIVTARQHSADEQQSL